RRVALARGAGRPRRVAPVRRAGRAFDPEPAAGDAAAYRDGGPPHGRDRTAPGPLRRAPPPPRRRLPGDGRLAGRDRDPRVLGWPAAHLAVLGSSRVGAVWRLRRLVERALAGRALAAAAGDRARTVPDGRAGQGHALLGARRAARGLRAHRARQGRERAR